MTAKEGRGVVARIRTYNLWFFPLEKKSLFFHLSERQHAERKSVRKNLHLVTPKCLGQSGFGQTKARSLELPSGSLCGWQRYLSHRLHISRELNHKGRGQDLNQHSDACWCPMELNMQHYSTCP